MLARFLEIAPRQHILYAYTMRTNGVHVSSSLVTVEFGGSAGRTTMIFTEQAAFSDPTDGESRENGTGVGLDRLCEAVAVEFERDAEYDSAANVYR